MPWRLPREGILVLPLPGLNDIEAPAEDGLTFAENAREKAIYYSRFLPGAVVLADDSGLEVDFLKGAPGVRSARYAADAGFHTAAAADANNNLFLLQQLTGVADNERSAQYQCVLTAAQDGASVLSAQGTVPGPHTLCSAGAPGASDTIHSFMYLLSTAPWQKWTIRPGGRKAIADARFVPYCNSRPGPCLMPNRIDLLPGPSLDAALIAHQ